MTTLEEEVKRFEPIIRRLCKFALLGKRIEVKGEENFIKHGPNIIIGNHVGSFKDVATLFKIVPRPIFFTANRMIFSRKDFDTLIRKHLKHHLKRFGLFLDLLLNPLKSLFVQYISTNIARVGTIPVDMYHSKSQTIERIQEYLKRGKVIIALQGRGRVMKKDPNPYVSSFKKGTSVIVHNLYKNNGLSIPVTPLAILGTQTPFMIPGKIKVNVGCPMYINDYVKEGIENSVETFRMAVETRVKGLLLELIRQ